MKVIFRQFFEKESSTYTYLLGCKRTRKAIIIGISPLKNLPLRPLRSGWHHCSPRCRSRTRSKPQSRLRDQHPRARRSHHRHSQTPLILSGAQKWTRIWRENCQIGWEISASSYSHSRRWVFSVWKGWNLLKISRWKLGTHLGTRMAAWRM